MIAFAACVADEEKYARCAVPGLQRVAEDDSLVMQAGDPASIFDAYNEVLDAVRGRDDLEALVLLHEDTEILDPEFCAKVRGLLADDDVAVAGVVGARGVRGLAWWEGQCFGRVVETRGVIDFGGGTHEVETVDGLIMVLSPWAVANLRFDHECFSGFDAYDADICFQARAAGRKVLVAPLEVAHRHSREGTERAASDGGSFERNDARWRAKWLDREAAASRAAGVGDADKGESYFEFDRPELRSLVPAAARRVLDVGCGAGALGAALKRERDVEVIGLEGFEDAAARARGRLDGALCMDLDGVEELPFERGAFDAIVFGDVLEHLRDPHRLLRALRPYLAPGGVIVCSIPNVRHWTVLFPLLVQDRWRYEDAGLLDRTHIHFFTLEEIGHMLDETGFEARHVGVNDLAPLPGELQPLVDLAVRFGGERAETAARLGAYQYLVVAGRKS
ncbi:MAG: bifunctional glycosyltransferase/class I SAM-dependent methyltransferase [Thermoleophilaceae bacterium]